MSTPVFDSDDPRLTAYALGESSEAERAEIERILAASPEAQAEVEKIVAFARVLEGEFHHENEVYWETRQAGPPSDKIVDFPVARRAAWKSTAAIVWKLAAVVVALGVLVHLTLRRRPSQPDTSLASSHSTGGSPLPVPAAPPAMEATPALDSLSRTNVPADADDSRSPTAAPAASASATASEADVLVAMAPEPARRDDEPASRAAVQPAMPSLENNQTAKSATRRETAGAAAPGANAPSATATGSGGGVASPVDRLSKSVVRIRAGDGSYVGGVVVTADGWILASSTLPKNGPRPIVIIVNGREVPATVSPEQSGSELHRLRIDGKTLPAATFATAIPADHEVLIVASTDRRTGATRFLRAGASVSGGEARIQWQDQPPTGNPTIIVFNSGGELLATATTPPAAKPDTRARVASDYAAPAGPLVRLFTAAERSLLRADPAKPAR